MTKGAYKYDVKKYDFRSNKMLGVFLEPPPLECMDVIYNMEFPKGEENVEEHKANEGGCLAKAHPGTDDAAGQVPSQTINDPSQKAHVGESKLCTCRRKDGGAKTCDGEAEVARVEGRVYCLMCALLIPTTTDREEEEEEEEARDIKPQVIGGIKSTSRHNRIYSAHHISTFNSDQESQNV